MFSFVSFCLFLVTCLSFLQTEASKKLIMCAALPECVRYSLIAIFNFFSSNEQFSCDGPLDMFVVHHERLNVLQRDSTFYFPWASSFVLPSTQLLKNEI